MTLLFTSQVRSPTDSQGTTASLDAFGESMGLGLDEGFDALRIARNTPDVSALRNYAAGVLARLYEQTSPPSEKSFVGSGRQPVVGGGADSHNPSTLEEASTRVYYTQSPDYSVIIKKKMFSGLQELYKPELLSPGDTWLMRATKRLVERKCAIMADYERISKVDKLAGQTQLTPATIMQGLMSLSTLVDGLSGVSENFPEFEAIRDLQRAAYDRQVPSVSTYYVDPDTPFIAPLGVGSGTFEITSVTTLSTNLSIDGDGSCSFTIEDPYQILIVTEDDIQAALLETSLINYILNTNRQAANSLKQAQNADRELSNLRSARNVSGITFSVDFQDGRPSATIDALDMIVTEDNLNDIPSSHALNTEESSLFREVLQNLENYNRTLTSSQRIGSGELLSEEIRAQMRYARNKMRLFFLGKSIIQAMDSVHVYVDGGTRRFGEGSEVPDNLNWTVSDLVERFFNNPSGDQIQYNEEAIKEEYNKKFKGKTSLSYEQYRVVRGLDMNGNGIGIHVFGGLVDRVTDKYEASSGKFTLSVECKTNMEWLRLSRYNTQPALTQTEGIVNDPLTPFIIGVDPSTGLPTGELELTPENKKRLGSCSLYFNNGANTGQRVRGMEDMKPDKRVLGGNIVSLYDHVPGLLYRWKEGIMTATYNVQTIDPKDKSFVSRNKMYREMGFFASKTPFDNMDAANIISTLVTGFPYNYTTFVQSSIQTGAFIPDTTFNSGKDFFHTFLNVVRSLNNVQGNFVPFSGLSTDSKQMADSLTQALGAQLQLSGTSNRMQQLRSRIATLDDKVRFLDPIEDQEIAAGLIDQREGLKKELEDFELSFSRAAREAPQKNNAIYIAGNDVVFDLENIKDAKEYKRFGDRLLFQLLRRREDVIYNKDKTYLVISDEYDKDFDIQAFVLRLREQSPDLWKNSYQNPLELCKDVAETLNFEFFADTQGHLIFRPPQYNRTPLSVLQAMLLLDRAEGVRLFPDFLLNLFKKREDSIVADIVAIELEIKMQTALLGAKNNVESANKIGQGNSTPYFISNREDWVRAIAKNKAIDPKQRDALSKKVKLANLNAKVSAQKDGVFSPISQYNLQESALKYFESLNLFVNYGASKKYYNQNRDLLINLIGSHKSAYPEYDDVEVGVSRNGRSTPATDISKIISTISNLVSRRSKLVRTLERVLDQTTQAAKLSEDGMRQLESSNFSMASSFMGINDELTGVLPKIIEDTRKDTLGHLSSQRFIIRDEHIKSQSFTEQPPALTNVKVAGTDPIVGEGGGNAFAGFPQYLALGVDFDMWRQYGWRGEQTFDKPFFWDAELQCAPYAVMLLSRQRKNVVQGNVTVVGNEFYQLGDVVFSNNRQLLYYVSGISHNISYEGSFDTTLRLTYGHPPGEYIPTPLDVIGKSMSSRGGSQNAFRMNRLTPVSESPVGAVLKFGETDNSAGLLSDKRNLHQLQNIVLAFKKDASENYDVSPRIYIMAFTDYEGHNSQIDAVRSWFINPQQGGMGGNSIGPDGAGGSEAAIIKHLGSENPSKFSIDPEHIYSGIIRQCSVDPNDLRPEERDFLRDGMVASDKAYRLAAQDGEDVVKLDKIVEVRIKYPPSGGWSSIEESEE